VIACFVLSEVEAKNKAGTLIKNAAKGYTAHSKYINIPLHLQICVCCDNSSI
jgi:hypothetical protein